MIIKPTNEQKCTTVHYTHRILLNVWATHVAIFRELHYKGRHIDVLQSFFNQSTYTCKNVKVPRNRPEGPERGRGIALLFLDLGARRGCVVSTTPRLLYPREDLRSPRTTPLDSACPSTILYRLLLN
jgi:hypothetical protein